MRKHTAIAKECEIRSASGACPIAVSSVEAGGSEVGVFMGEA
ncbi:hypothetical protein RBSWK_05471 [Rhodopirellula baltica SWK14]|uniref:Uncharacterized protein n=1 Tax=Rhodopirellula baltica SWK14 TaxID=993516 RepID=L7C8U1_RHOBT|nr:hypothetical protein RBSWK_05471 [Rhodopirellula baltica SWK14]